MNAISYELLVGVIFMEMGQWHWQSATHCSSTTTTSPTRLNSANIASCNDCTPSKEMHANMKAPDRHSAVLLLYMLHNEGRTGRMPAPHGTEGASFESVPPLLAVRRILYYMSSLSGEDAYRIGSSEDRLLIGHVAWDNYTNTPSLGDSVHDPCCLQDKKEK
eukprot:4493710-Amphidinium_carterae.1